MLKRVVLQTYGLVVGGATLLGMYTGLQLEGQFSSSLTFPAIGTLTLTTEDSITKAAYVGMKMGAQAILMPTIPVEVAGRLVWAYFQEKKN
jgi:hypothetical protein